jgi:hypothetical protein
MSNSHLYLFFTCSLSLSPYLCLLRLFLYLFQSPPLFSFLLSVYPSLSLSYGEFAPTTNKRGSDALGDTAQEGSSQKKIRTAQTPSKVIHARNLPQDCTESDLLAVSSPFGQVVNVLLMKGKNQALIQMGVRKIMLFVSLSSLFSPLFTPLYLSISSSYFSHLSRFLFLISMCRTNHMLLHW